MCRCVRVTTYNGHSRLGEPKLRPHHMHDALLVIAQWIDRHPELGTVKRNGSEYECTIRLGHGPNAPHETRFPAPIVLENHYGPIELPLYDVVPEPEDEEPTE